MPSTLLPLDEVTATAREIVERIVWCTVTTVTPDGAPRNRLMHPVWRWDGDAPEALVTSRLTPIKLRHLAANPHVSCFYWDPSHDTAAIDATAEWVPAEDIPEAWETIRTTPPPVGFDPAMIWPDGPTSDGVGILRFTAHRIVATKAAQPGLRWTAAPT
ncbi:MAG: pyridoxamine 5'-phosphate oxidase family protein [Actinomycetota bacterium]|nr:pyridoxamine 5'-phosphate oxidase family protein [Actinomycetota bacterium]